MTLLVRNEETISFDGRKENGKFIRKSLEGNIRTNIELHVPQNSGQSFAYVRLTSF